MYICIYNILHRTDKLYKVVVIMNIYIYIYKIKRWLSYMEIVICV